MKSLLFASVLAAAAQVAAESPPPAAHPAQPQSPDAKANNTMGAIPSIVAWVNATPIYFRDVQHEAATIAGGANIDPAQVPQIQATALQVLIERVLLSRFLETSKLQATPQEVDDALNEMRKGLLKQGSSLTEYLQDNKKTEDVLREQLGQELALKKYLAQNTTDDALEVYFNRNRAQFDGTERRASHILFRPAGTLDSNTLRTLTFQAEQLRGQIVVGDITFEAAAEKYSAGPSRHHGGDLGFFPRQGVMTQQVSETVYSLKPGEISHPVPDSFGVHLIKVTEIKPGHKTWREARDQLKSAYGRVLIGQVMADMISKARIEFTDNFPHFIPGTRQLAQPQPVGTKP